MGWLFFEKPSDVRGYLDAQCTGERENGSFRVLDSAIVARSEYYAAVEHIAPEGERMVFAVICLLKFVPRAHDGYTFGYKDMDETVGPNAARCPVRILDLLTDTDYPYAKAWRERCREYHARRAALPKLREGMKLRVMDENVPTIDGIPLREVSVLRAGTKPLFKVEGFGGYFRWPSWRQYNVQEAV